MGKRKAAKKPAPKRKAEPLSSVFKCLFCNHEKAVTVKLDKATMFGHLNCKICGQKYSTPINNLSAAVDVYCDWVDACEEVQQKQPPKQRIPRGPDPLSHGRAGGASVKESVADDEGDQVYNFAEDDEEDERRQDDHRGEKRRKTVEEHRYDDDDE
ncbi:hypothetical protein L204_101625 [Cryptococcus depauperatus]|nr:hypothetical protein L204_04411 [Cryptococcus depauperatus CBS 7855]